MASLAAVGPNEVTLVAVVGACGELGAWAHAYALRRGLAVNWFVATALVEMYSRCGRMDLGEQVFDGVTGMDMRCYNGMLQGLAFHGHGRAARALFERMRGEGVPVDDAEKLIRRMDFPPNAAMYRSLIRACGIHGKLDLGERIIEELMRAEPEHSGNYVLLSNFDAKMRLWEDAKKARKEMKAMGIDKCPGSSLLDIDGVLHEFLMDDKTHPASREIHAMIQEIEARLNECGHRPSTTAVLFDVEEEDKADTLSYHSERLDIAFALLASAPGVPVRIIKNLRVCSDCHESTKLVSRVYGREIIMRDCTRFRRFRDGHCSCGDFW